MNVHVARFIICSGLLVGSVVATPVAAELCGGVEFPEGCEVSFADQVIRYDNLFGGGPAPTEGVDPNEALGPPDQAGSVGDVSLGRGGLIELAFVDNVLTNSGSSDPDLHIFEVGPQVEDTFVAVRPADAATFAAVSALCVDARAPQQDGYCEVGKVTGGTSSIDVDAFFAGFPKGTLRFDAVQLIDDRNEGGTSGSTVGADIDAVGAISTAPSPPPEGCADEDADGETDGTDRCPGTSAGEPVDDSGCSLAQFCGAIDATTKQGSKACKKSDWKNDEPLMKPKRDGDCTVDKGGKGRADDRCVPK